MSNVDYYYTIEKNAYAELKERGSRFLAYAYPITAVEDFKIHLQALKKEHPKAVHYCFAYRMGVENNIFRSSDDGEPSGTAGKPILGQIDSKQLTNVLVVVVRYFGGTLLGVPGLIQAYKSAAAMVLQLIPAVQKPIEINYTLRFDYHHVNLVMAIIKQYQCSIIQQEMGLFCIMQIGVARARLEEVLFKLNELHAVEVITDLNTKLFP